MALAETASLIVDLSLKGNFSKNLGQVGGALRKFDARLDYTEGRAYRFGQQIGTGIKNAARIAVIGLGFLATNVGLGLRSLDKLEQQTLQTNAAIKSTKGIAGITAQAVRDLAEKYESLNATVGDEVIQSTENLLLTFTNIRRKAFEPALRVILDMNERLGRGPGGLANTARIVGRALNDPIKGLGLLSRTGVTFSAGQIKRIKLLVKEGKLYQAQEVILAELNKRFGGSFLAGGGTTGAKIAKFHDAIEDLQRTLAAGLLPVVSNVADALSKLLADPKVVASVNDFGKQLAGFFTPANIDKGVGVIKDVVTLLTGMGPILRSAAGGIRTIVSTAVTAFRSLPEWVQKITVGALVLQKLTGGAVTNLLGAGLEKLFARGSITNPMYVVDVTGGGLGKGNDLTNIGKTGIIATLLKLLPFVGVASAELAIADAIAAPLRDALGVEAGGLGTVKAEIAGFKIVVGQSTAALAHALQRVGSGEGLLDQRHGEQRAGKSGPDHVTPVLREIARNTRVLRSPVHTFPPLPGAGLREQRRGEFGGPLGGSAIRHALPPGHDLGGITAAAINNQAAVLKGMSQIEDRRGTEITAAVQRKGEQTVGSVDRARSQVASTSIAVVGATNNASASIVAAIWAARPIVNVTNVTKTTTIQERIGPSNGSYGYIPKNIP